MRNSNTKRTAGMNTLVSFLKCASLPFKEAKDGAEAQVGGAELTFRADGSLCRITLANGTVVELDAQGLLEGVLSSEEAA